MSKKWLLMLCGLALLVNNALAQLPFSETNAELTLKFMVNDKPATSEQIFSASDKINLFAEIKVDASEVGQETSLYAVMMWNSVFFLMKNELGAWQPWSGELNELIARSTKILSETEALEIISGLKGMTGDFVVFVGYKAPQTGEIIYNAKPVTFSVQSVQQIMSNSLHGTTRGMAYFYAKEQGGFEQFTGKHYDELPCSGCHIEQTACTTCHEVPGDSPDNDKCLESCHKRQNTEQQFHPDIHLMDKAAGGAGLKCASCHSAKQVHGDGTPYNSLHENLNNVDCEQSGCHKDITIAGKPMHETHVNDLECAACHVKTTMTCYSCHFADGSVFQPPIADWKILVKSKVSGKVTTGNIQTMAAGGNSLLVVAPYYGHTISKGSETTCSSCHDSDAVREYKETGTMTLATWHDTDKTINNIKGVVPIPSDWQTALKMDFIAKDENGEWAYEKDEADATQMFFADPIDVSKMPKL